MYISCVWSNFNERELLVDHQKHGKRQKTKASNKSTPLNEKLAAILCNRCGKHHETSKCHWKSGACFQCGEIGHKVKDCPQKQGSQESEPKGNAQKPQAQGIVDAITQQDAEASKVVIEDHQKHGKRQKTKASNKSTPLNEKLAAILCNRCGKHHETSKCHWKSGACFQCGEIGHKVKDCPQKQGSQESELKGNAQEIQTQGRVDAPTQQDAKASKAIDAPTQQDEEASKAIFEEWRKSCSPVLCGVQ
eukprot:TRINITY_DN4537_c0_g1_i3.p1 TRINITY_DN4537_c0_g1~~TRINITY_DN4537_c0_g1_i3.p1  ORF type:complete len:248 (-),score=51.37 TRINITY_DN4537_c0_g1_i3:153-896(-)